MGNYKKLGKNTILVFVGSFGAKLIGLLMLPIYTRWLSVEDYGLCDVLSVYASLLLSIVTFCIGESLFIFPKGKDYEKQSEYYTSGFSFAGMMCLTTILVFLIIKKLSNFFMWEGSFFDNIWLVYIMLVSQVIQQLTQQYTRSIDKMFIYSMSGVVNTVLIALFSFLFIPRYGVIGYIICLSLANVFTSFYSVFCSKSYRFFKFKNLHIASLKEMLKYSIPLIPNGIMWWLVSALNRPIMEHSLGLHEIGIYSVANKFPGILSMVFTIFVSSWQISVLEEFGKKDYNNFYNVILKSIFGLLIFTLFVLTIGSKLLITVFATKEFYSAWQYVAPLTLGVLISNMSSFIGTNFSATRESKYYFISSIYGATVAILLNFILIPIIGIWGAVISSILSFASILLARIYFTRKAATIDKIYQYFILIVIASIFILLSILEKHILALITSIVLLAYLIYFEREIISKAFNKIRIIYGSNS